MADLFKKIRLRQYKSVYERLIYIKTKSKLKEDSLKDYFDIKNYESGRYELDILEGKETVIDKPTFELNKGINLFYNGDISSIMLITEFLKKTKALESINGFESYIFSQDHFDESKLKGLSILLMRDTNSIETVKFGIIITKYYPLENVEGAIEIIKNLCIYPEFTYYALNALKTLKNYREIEKEISKDILGLGKEIEEYFK